MIPPLLFQLMILLSWPINALAESPAIAKPNCPTSCGNGNGSVSIQFPFGIGDGCYLDHQYEVTCISGTPFLRSINLTVLNISISLEASTILVNHTVLRSCDLESTRFEYVRNETVNLESSPFFFSDENRFIGVGCNTFAYLSSNRSIISGCMSFCEKSNISAETMPSRNVTLHDSDCNGIKCCRTRIPSFLNLQQLEVTLNTTNSKENTTEPNKCKSAFLVDQEWFGNNIDSPDKAQGLKHDVPVLLDWGIHESSFDLIERNLSKSYNKTSDCNHIFAHSTSTNTFTNATFTMPVRRCRCNPGYEGNPYLLHGCQDFDECKIIDDRRICYPSDSENCETIKYYNFCGSAVSDTVCINTDGGFECYPNKIYRDTKSLIMIGIGIGFGGLFLLIGARWLYIIVKRRKNIKHKEEYFKLLLQQQLTSLDGSTARSKLFNSKELDKATDHFNKDRILGQGGQAIPSTSSQDNRSLATHFIVSMVENNLFDILDPEVTKVGKKEEIMTFANLAKSCLNLNGKKRPTMKEVATVLEGIQASQKESNVQQNYEEVECVGTELIEPWDVVSTSTSSTFEIVSKSVDVQPQLTK
ncbi:hypothetical protein QYF36_003438 [Acer negundo]|nr:hypothetical protein QYF36_003438 [Acer negundo]